MNGDVLETEPDSINPALGGNADVNLVTLCSWSKTVKYEGDWITIEKYLDRRFGLRATHGISPQAMEGLQAELDAGVRESRQGVRPSPTRLAALESTGLLDSEPSIGFDRITRLGAAVLGVPATFISLVDAQRDFYLSNCGFGEPLATDRQLTGQTFCHFTIEHEEPLVIPDTRADPVYRDVPTVASLGVAAYLGAPLVMLSGEVMGAFCAIDQVPRRWTDIQIQSARDLAALVVSEIELRQAIRNSQKRVIPAH